MIRNEKLNQLFHTGSVNKEITIQIGENITIHNEDIYTESLTIEESLCEEDNLTFGLGCSSRLEVQIYNVEDVTKGQTVSVFITLEGAEEEPLQLFYGIIDSAEMSGDKKYKKITAYDPLYTKESTEMAGWYNDLDFPLTLKQFRDSFFKQLGMVQEDVQLVNDDMLVERTIQPSQLIAATVITAICQINACFGHAGRDGTFRYVFLLGNLRAIYPSYTLYPSDKVFPQDSDSRGDGLTIDEEIDKGTYITCTYEDYETAEIDKLQIRQEENDIGVIVGEGKNCYVIEDNFLVYGKMSARFAEQKLQEALTTKKAAVAEAEKEYTDTITAAQERLKQADEIKADYNEKIADAKKEMQETIDAVEPNYVAAVKKIEETYKTDCATMDKEHETAVQKLKGDKVSAELAADQRYTFTVGEAEERLANGEITQSKYDSIVKTAQEEKTAEYASATDSYNKALSEENAGYSAAKIKHKRKYQTQLENAKKDKEKALETAGTKCAEKFMEAQKMLSGTITQEEYEEIVKTAATTKENAINEAETTYQNQCDDINSKSNGDEIGENIYNIMQDVSVYRPFEVETVGNPMVEVGDSIQIGTTNNEVIVSYVLKRTLTGIQALKDTYSAMGDERYPESSDSTNSEIVQLKGKLNTLIRTVEETTSQIQDIEKGLSSIIWQTAESITMEVLRSVKSEDGITEYASKIEQKAESIALAVAEKTEGGDTWESILQLAADSIKSKVGKGDVVSSINQSKETVTIDASKINLNGVVTANGNFKIGTDGKMEAVGAKLSGDVEAKTFTCCGYLKMKLNDEYPALRIMKIDMWPDDETQGQGYGGEVIFSREIGNLYFKPYVHFDDYVNFNEGFNAKSANIDDNVYCDGNVKAESFYADSSCSPYFDCGDESNTATAANLGGGSRRWNNIYARTTTINTSDKNSKHDINPIEERYEKLWKKIKPVSFLFNNGDRVHLGIIAQDLEEAMSETGLTANELAMFCKDVKQRRIEGTDEFEDVINENGEKEYLYGVRYGELIALNTHMTQKLYKENEELKNEVSELKEAVKKQNDVIEQILSKLGE